MSALFASALAMAGAWSLPAGEAAEPVASAPSAEAAPGQRDLALRWTGPVEVSAEAGPYEVVVRFDRPLDQAEIDRFAKAAGPLLADLRWNDASLVLRPAAGNRIETARTADGLAVHFIADRDDAAPEPTPLVAPAPADTAELALVRAQADAAAGYPGQARRRLMRLAAAEPDNASAQRALGDAEAADGSLLAAARRYRALGADDLPARRIMAEADGRTTGQLILRHGKTFTQWEAGLDGAMRAGDGLTLGGGIRQVTTTANDVADATGLLARVHDSATVGQIGATAFIGPWARLTAQVASRLDRDGAGVMARLVVGSTERQARLVAAWHLPDFSTAEQAHLGGSINRAGGGGTLRLSPELVVQGDLAWTGYGLAGQGVPTTSLLASGGIDYLVLRGRRSLQISYRLDAEYVRRMRLRGNGLAFIPLSDRENHTVQAIFSTALHKVQVTAAAGWTWDRKGGSGPTASLGAVANLGAAWRLEASAGVSSVSRPAISGRQVYLQFTLTRFWRR
ncbi:hypothetical protein ACFOD9_10225 [Novosphingobium bradum]|uniref:Uncharacterized protein n=1 Tax=Novosphingobium bradum TaxID=1737444 RepID=A0ABV7IUL2_9SPHN